MKINIYFILLLVTSSNAQFGGFNPFAGITDTVTQGLNQVVSSVPLLSNVQNFADFAAQTGKTYATAAERQLREGVFSLRKNLVDANNAAFAAGSSTFESAINAFSDLTNTEFLKQLTGLKKSTIGENNAKRNKLPLPKNIDEKVPKAFDWREKGGVTPVKFQGDCGSCWSFAVTGAIEGHVFRKIGKLPNLSEQNLVDCGKEDLGLAGCDGGFQEYGFNFVTLQNGIALGDKYPYVDKKDTCRYNANLKGAEIKGFASINPKDENTMKAVISKLGPLACSINGLESLLLYKRGIYDDEECNKDEVNHSILVVGYGVENGREYWIVKNSWGSTWGEDGYFRLPLGKNFCGIASECSYPVLKT